MSTSPAPTDTRVAPVPAGYQHLTPYLTVPDARRALDWYVEVFAAVRRGEPYVMPDGRIGHAELAVGDSVLMLSDEFEEEGIRAPATVGGTSVALLVYVADVDATVARAVAAAAEVEGPVKIAHGSRRGTVRDPFGHRWLVATAVD